MKIVHIKTGKEYKPAPREIVSVQDGRIVSCRPYIGDIKSMSYLDDYVVIERERNE